MKKLVNFLIYSIIIFSISFLFIQKASAAEYACHVCGSGDTLKYYWNNYDTQFDESCSFVDNALSEDECLKFNEKKSSEGYKCHACGTGDTLKYYWNNYETQADESCNVVDIKLEHLCLIKNDNTNACYVCSDIKWNEYKWIKKSEASANCVLKKEFTTQEQCLLNESSSSTNSSNNITPSGSFEKMLKEAFNIIRVVGVGLVLVLSSLDFFKAMLEASADTMKKTANNAFKRLIYAVIIFFLPTLVDLIISLVEGFGSTGF